MLKHFNHDLGKYMIINVWAESEHIIYKSLVLGCCVAFILCLVRFKPYVVIAARNAQNVTQGASRGIISKVIHGFEKYDWVVEEWEKN